MLVSNGHVLKGKGQVQQLPLDIQGHLIQLLAYVLFVIGGEVVLGASWLATLGLHVAIYSKATIKFYLNGKFITFFVVINLLRFLRLIFIT